ncbi:NAD-dependent epimerase/dehydratase family protein [Serratia marcescens]|uniref:NAD-dependent epimerase/dehydratase family protein n=1 Tax=Serratia marcescens TaxID=615 RepID=UPI002853039A|nr:NAD-dependent epimerase/dehydratase family protein [Serratia marcescens]MDR4885904.1 NAD-dependent epimerase/dehydratase family protein [Serratia marcescens]
MSDLNVTIPKNAKILVTGATGFVGSHTVLRLLRGKHKTRVTIRSEEQRNNILQVLNDSGVDIESNLEFVIADLWDDEGWDEAVDGMNYIIHHASPFPVTPPKDENELIIPARDGTLRVLTAASKAKVSRVVITSSYAAVGYTITPDDHYTEANWTDSNTFGLPAYHKSKILAERAAWDFVSTHPELELVVINPTGIFGPELFDRPSGSIGLISAMLSGNMPAVPIMYFGVVDVRDVVDIHLRAMVHPKAAGERFLAVSGSSLSLFDASVILREEFPEFTGLLPSKELTIDEVRDGAKTNPSLRDAAALQGRIPIISNEKARTILEWSPLDVKDTIIDTAKALFELGVVNKV